MVAWTRSITWGFLRTLETSLLTVSSLTKGRGELSRFFNPAAMRPGTFVSLGSSPQKGGGG
ncbi:MAG: hypothetical protein AVDCRST_MAG05-3360 [uncultured Rubrobacteraceae bacterium]|uniref:Uncharacterized protein n=1 Tax=uncultured Rubrobacteraceae bacterium TaxID=349277 RepID=A0A6J4T987_9ACTN|nr:MAG: hypothetical protein AVDCRST_MAG05-3360 [uncultured Rubrobacteraceae bacterium]